MGLRIQNMFPSSPDLKIYMPEYVHTCVYISWASWNWANLKVPAKRYLLDSSHTFRVFTFSLENLVQGN